MMSSQDLANVIAATKAANDSWVQGEWERGYGALISTGDDVSIFGPFGGPAVEGATWAQRGAKAVRQFSNGTSELKLIQHYASDDLLVLVTLEEQKADIAGRPAQPWSLRVTQVYRRENGAWKIVHRHADPLTAPRTLDGTLVLAARE